MKNDDEYRVDARFGKIAVKRGYITIHHLKEALCKQVDDDLADLPHQLIGEIILKKKWMTLEQIEDVLSEMFNIRKEKGSLKSN